MGLDANDLVTLTIHGEVFGQKTLSTFGYKVLTPSTDADTITALTTLADEWQTQAASPYGAFIACMSPQFTTIEIRAQRISPARSVPGVKAVGGVGTNANATNSPNQAAVITKGGSQSGRRYIGGLHLPALGAANMLSGFVTNAYLALMSTLGSKMLNAILDNTDGTTLINPVLLHRTPGSNNWTATEFTRTIPQRTVRVMRRRTIGVGK